MTYMLGQILDFFYCSDTQTIMAIVARVKLTKYFFLFACKVQIYLKKAVSLWQTSAEICAQFVFENYSHNNQ